jgi:hypothetical protein
MIVSLATLDDNRGGPAMFREELFNALPILDRGDIEGDRWPAVMGQLQSAADTQYADHDRWEAR